MYTINHINAMCRAPLLIRNYLDTPEMKNLIGVASRGRKLRNCKVRALETSVVQYCDKFAP